MNKKVLIIQGGWDGHEPVLVSQRFHDYLVSQGVEVVMSDTLDSLLDLDYLKTFDMIIPIWTMGGISYEQCQGALRAVASGVGLAGCHGGMCDAFRMDVDWQFMTGSQWVSHPGGGVKYRVNIISSSNPITEGIPDFDVESEQYYIHIDPCVEVLATTRFPVADGPHRTNGFVDVPIAYTKRWGHGRVFYTTLGHVNSVFDIPEAFEIMKRGMMWAIEGKAIAVAKNGSESDFGM